MPVGEPVVLWKVFLVGYAVIAVPITFLAARWVGRKSREQTRAAG